MKNRLRVNLISYMILVVVGIGLIGFSALGYLDEFWSGMGIALLVVSALNIVRIMRYKMDGAYAAKIEIRNSDERNRYLAEKARSRGLSYSVFLECVAVIVLRVLDFPAYSTLLGFVICGQLLVYYGSYLYLRKKY